MALATLDAGIQRVFGLLRTQPAEIAAAGGELLEAGSNPTEHLIDVIALGNHGDLRGVCCEPAVL